RIILLALLFSAPALANISGFVTPTEMTITFTSAQLIKSDNTNITLLSGSYPTTFTKGAADFASISLASITAPEGRFIGVQICYNTDRSVKLNNDKYYGIAGG